MWDLSLECVRNRNNFLLTEGSVFAHVLYFNCAPTEGNYRQISGVGRPGLHRAVSVRCREERGIAGLEGETRDTGFRSRCG
jgi:hypothetical protein